MFSTKRLCSTTNRADVMKETKREKITTTKTTNNSIFVKILSVYEICSIRDLSPMNEKAIIFLQGYYLF